MTTTFWVFFLKSVDKNNTNDCDHCKGKGSKKGNRVEHNETGTEGRKIYRKEERRGEERSNECGEACWSLAGRQARDRVLSLQSHTLLL